MSVQPAKLIPLSRLLVGLLVAVVGIACTPVAAPTAGAASMRVELDVFSGRPNPSWNLTNAEGQELLTRLEALPRTDQGTVNQNLGYRGLTVEAAYADASAFSSLVVSNGIVVAHHSNGDAKFLDQERILERWLFQTGQGRVDSILFKDIQRRLNP